MALDKEIKKILRSDLKLAKSNVREILNKPELNRIVTAPDYLYPTVRQKKGVITPLDDSKGTYLYYSKIAFALYCGLNYGKINQQNMPLRAPDYLTNLLSKD